jgi:hypothetical protein
MKRLKVLASKEGCLAFLNQQSPEFWINQLLQAQRANLEQFKYPLKNKSLVDSAHNSMILSYARIMPQGVKINEWTPAAQEYFRQVSPDLVRDVFLKTYADLGNLLKDIQVQSTSIILTFNSPQAVPQKQPGLLDKVKQVFYK